MDEVQEKIIAEAGEGANDGQPGTPEVPEGPSEKPARKRRKISVPKREGGKLRLARFDFILLQLLKEGKAGMDEVRGAFNVDENIFRERLGALAENGYISISDEARAVSLGLRSVNEYSQKWKKAADEWLGRKEPKKERRKEAELKAEEKEADAGSPENAEKIPDFASTIQAKLPVEFLWKELEQRHVQLQELPEEKRKEETIDLMELMKNYGPTDAQKELLKKTSPFVERHMRRRERRPAPELKAAEGKITAGEKAGKKDGGEISAAGRGEAASEGKPFYNRAISELSQQAAALEASGEKCELCKTGFMISVKQEEHNPKYGHCFCGAPYHKDCYEGITAGEGKCVRCGRKMAAGSDFKVEDAFKQIRDISF